jgi:hypothetical protein
VRRCLPILALLPALLAAAMWVRSYWRFDFGVAHGWTVGSDSGSRHCPIWALSTVESARRALTRTVAARE